jgi:hypothetical protein
VLSLLVLQTFGQGNVRVFEPNGYYADRWVQFCVGRSHLHSNMLRQLTCTLAIEGQSYLQGSIKHKQQQLQLGTCGIDAWQVQPHVHHGCQRHVYGRLLLIT